jgi:hypothetical protein
LSELMILVICLVIHKHHQSNEDSMVRSLHHDAGTVFAVMQKTKGAIDCLIWFWFGYGHLWCLEHRLVVVWTKK